MRVSTASTTRLSPLSVPLSRTTRRTTSARQALPLTSNSLHLRRQRQRSSVVVVRASLDDSSPSIPPSTPQEAPSSQQSSHYAGNKAISIPWYHITAGRTFLAVSSLKMLALTLPTSYFATTMLSGTGNAVPLGFWQSLLAVVAGVGLALVARRLEKPGGFVSKATRAQWVGLVSAGVFACVLFAKLVPGRTLIDIRRERGRAMMTTQARAASAPPAAENSNRPRPLRTAADADAMLSALEKKAASLRK